MDWFTIWKIVIFGLTIGIITAMNRAGSRRLYSRAQAAAWIGGGLLWWFVRDVFVPLVLDTDTWFFFAPAWQELDHSWFWYTIWAILLLFAILSLIRARARFFAGAFLAVSFLMPLAALDIGGVIEAMGAWFWVLLVLVILMVLALALSRIGLAALAFLLALAVLFVGGANHNWWQDTPPSDAEAPTLPTPSVTSPTTTVPKPTQTPTGTATPTGEACPPMFVQKFDPNKLNRYVSGGIYAPSALEASGKDLAALAQDARILAIRANQLKLWPSLDPRNLLEPGYKCLSRMGQDVWNQVKGALTADGVIIRFGKASDDWVNTGIKDGKLVVAKKPGITGDLKTLEYIIKKDGQTIKIVVLVRCANLVFEVKPPGVPTGPTDNPSTPSPSPSLQKKSSDRSDYVHKGGAPKAAAQGDASDASEVDTGGTDSATTESGTTGSVTAPGAVPVPARTTQPVAPGGQTSPAPTDTSCDPPPGMTSC